VLQASRSSLVPLVERVCRRRWIELSVPNTTLGAGPNVCSHLPLGSGQDQSGLGLKQSSFHHTRLALTTQRIGGFLLRGRLHMLWSPSPFGVGVSGVCRELSISSHNLCCTQHLPLKRRTERAPVGSTIAVPHFLSQSDRPGLPHRDRPPQASPIRPVAGQGVSPAGLGRGFQ
jgi:hypothetical protein